MGQYTQFGLFDPASGARITTGAPDVHPTGSLDAQAWTPPADLVSCDPHDEPGYEVGEGPPSGGPVPENIVGGELRAFEDDFDDSDNGDISDGFDDDFSELDGDCDPQDGDCDPQDGDCLDDNEDVDDGPVAGNIIVDSRGLRGAQGVIPGPMSRSRL